MNEKPKRKLRWRLLRWGLIVLAMLVTLVAVLITEENWRGKHAWENYKHDAEARGDSFVWADFAPTNVPDDQNFFCAPIVTKALQHERNKDVDNPSAHSPYRLNFNMYRGASENWPEHGGDWQKAELTDLKQWQRYFRTFNETPEGKTNGFPVPAPSQTPAADVLSALSCFTPALDELRQASLRPYARMPLDYASGFDSISVATSHLATEKRCAQFLLLRSIAELQDDQAGPALADIELLLRLTDTLRDQPFLISHLVRIAMQHITLQAIYEGLAQHRWNDAQLADLETALAAKDYLADFQFAMRGERTCAIATFENWRRTHEMKSVAEGRNGVDTVVTNSMRLMPAAFFYQNELAFARLHEHLVLPLVDMTNRTVSVATFNHDEADIKEMAKHYSPYTVLANMSFPAVSKSVQKFATVQGQVDLARVACALERYHLAHGEYPSSLDTLAPQFIEKIPHDIINGQPLHYRRTDDAKYVLYSVGWNETDDGGQV
ncbi:MAG: hypothetical protein JF609_05290, partial [Verrucomicrobia bacterium]|nr:hypothetical protein [Verrucomicrobiota bacterium]